MHRRFFVAILMAAGLWAETALAQAPAEGTGPYPALMEQDPGLPTHTIYRPKDLSKLNGYKLPIVAWGNGACVNAGDAFKNFLTEIASHGFLAIAIGPIAVGGLALGGSAIGVVSFGGAALGLLGGALQPPRPIMPRPSTCLASSRINPAS